MHGNQSFCVEHKIDLYALTPFLAHPSGRPSTHLSDSPQRMYLRLKRSIQNILERGEYSQ